MPRNSGKGSEYYTVIWEEGLVNFICPQMSEYLGVLKYFVYIGVYVYTHTHKYTHIHTCVCILVCICMYILVLEYLA